MKRHKFVILQLQCLKRYRIFSLQFKITNTMYFTFSKFDIKNYTFCCWMVALYFGLEYHSTIFYPKLSQIWQTWPRPHLPFPNLYPLYRLHPNLTMCHGSKIQLCFPITGSCSSLWGWAAVVALVPVLPQISLGRDCFSITHLIMALHGTCYSITSTKTFMSLGNHIIYTFF